MRITLRRSSIRFLAVVFEGGLFLVFVLGASKTFLAYRVAQSPTVGTCCGRSSWTPPTRTSTCGWDVYSNTP